MPVCGQHVLSGTETMPGMMGTDDPQTKQSEQHESHDESLLGFVVGLQVK